MSSEETRERILEEAEGLFGRQGYAGTSFRQITSQADVNLAAIHYHFGSKKALFGAVLARRLKPIVDERLHRLEVLEAAAEGRPLVLESIIEAFLQPALDHVRASGSKASWVKLIGWFRLEPGEHWQGAMELLEPGVSRYLRAFAAALPHLSEKVVAYGYYFLEGVEVNTLTDTSTPAYLHERLPNIHEDPEGVMARLISFAAAGMRAPLQTKKSSDRSKPRSPATQSSRSE